ncbi:MAG TPA: AAA family ATPase [Rhizomicrobium sp.]|jgi:NadR type nicotinamide-nucleotide adenylyltransferase|nr:AAA family ATPase [Rhizomicrobium sp.]
MTRGFLLGKFMPPHLGHVALCDFARATCDALTVLVCTRPGEPIDGDLRFQWMRELCPGARVVHYAKDVPQEPSEHPDFWTIWRDIARAAHPEKVDFVFASEEYGARLAYELDADFVPFDPKRLSLPVSASMVRDDPFAAWRFLPPPVRAHYVKTVCLHGPESTGKSTLSAALAAHYDTVMAPEYGRTYCEVFGNECDADDLRAIVHGHDAQDFAARRQANKLLVLDTDAVITAVWSDMLLGHRAEDLDRVSRTADLYILCDIDIPWHFDGTRYTELSAREVREDFFARAKGELERRGLPFVVARGSHEERLKTAIAAIDAKFPELKR